MKQVSKRKELMERLIKEEVVETVLRLIREDRQITMDEVARECGVAKGTLYNYFKHKKDMLTFVHGIVLLPLKEGYRKLYGAPIPPLKKVHAFVDNVFKFQNEYPLYFKFIQSHRSAAEAISERMSVTILPLVAVCKEGIGTGEFMEADPYAMAAMIFGAVVGTMESLRYREAPVADMDLLKQDILRMVDRILLKKAI